MISSPDGDGPPCAGAAPSAPLTEELPAVLPYAIRVLQARGRAEFEGPQSRKAAGAGSVPGEFGQGEGGGDEEGQGVVFGNNDEPAWNMDGDDGFGGDDDDIPSRFGKDDNFPGVGAGLEVVWCHQSLLVFFQMNHVLRWSARLSYKQPSWCGHVAAGMAFSVLFSRHSLRLPCASRAG